MRRPDLAGHLQPLGRVGQIHAVQANVRHPGSVEAAVRDADVVVNLVGILFERGRQRFDAVQAFGAEQVALRRGAPGARMVHVSAIGADEHSTSAYARAKAEGEKAVLAATPDGDHLAALDHVRPGGRLLQQVRGDGALAAGAAADRRRRDQVPAGVRRRRRRGDRARASKARQEAGAIYELGGPEVQTFKELMEYVLAIIERRRLLVPMPFALARLKATFLQFLPKPLLTPDQVELLKRDNVVSAEAARDGRTLAGLGIEPTAMEVDRAVLSLALPQDRTVQGTRPTSR